MYLKNMILISDYDYTLCNHDDMTKTPINLSAVQRWRKQNNIFIIATGRSVSALRFDFPEYRDYADYIVFNDGALVLDNHDCPISADHVPAKTTESLREILERHDYVDDHSVISYHESRDLQGIRLNSNKFRLWFKSKDDCVAIAEAITTYLPTKLKCHIYHDVPNFDIRLNWISEDMHYLIEVINRGTDKSTGVKAVLNKLQCSNYANEHIYAVGDDLNDHGMLEQFNGYVVSNAKPTLLSRFPSSRVVDSVASLINQIIQKTPAI